MIVLRNLRHLPKMASPMLLKNFKVAKTGFLAAPFSLYRPVMFNFSTQNDKKTVILVKTGEDFEEKILNSDKPVILDFYADWCGPCKRLTPLLEDRYNKSNGEWVFAKCNIDEFQDLAQAFNVNSIPTVALINKGQVVDQFVGLPPEHKLDDFIKKAATLDNRSA